MELVQLEPPAPMVVLTKPPAGRIAPVGRRHITETRFTFNDTTLPFDRGELPKNDRDQQDIKAQVKQQAATLTTPQAFFGGQLSGPAPPRSGRSSCNPAAAVRHIG